MDCNMDYTLSEILKIKTLLKKPKKKKQLSVCSVMPMLKIEIFSRYILMYWSNIGLGLVEMLSALDSGFRQTSYLILENHIPQEKTCEKHNQNDMDLRKKSENIFLNMLMATNCVYYIISGARKEVVTIKPLRQGDFVLAIDPIDAVENATTALPVGTTFGIYRCKKKKIEDYRELQCSTGTKSLIVSGYVIYGPATLLVICYREEKRVLEFCFDWILGEFVLTNDNLRIPEIGNVCCVNCTVRKLWLNTELNEYLDELKFMIFDTGSLVANFHSVLINGGMVIDPPSKDKPRGQFQILTKLNPLALICNIAGGFSFGDDLFTQMLDIYPESLYGTTPCIMGSHVILDMWHKKYYKKPHSGEEDDEEEEEGEQQEKYKEGEGEGKEQEEEEKIEKKKRKEKKTHTN